MKKFLLVHGEGLGNIVEALPLVKTIEAAFGPVDVALSKTSFDIPKDLFPGRTVYLPGENVPEGPYEGKIVTIWPGKKGREICSRLRVLNDIRKQGMRLDRSEVDVYLNAARDMGINKASFQFNCKDMLGFIPTDERFDVVIANGYNWKMGDLWKAKAYRNYEEVVAGLKEKGLSVCSIGVKSEHVPGTEDRTGIGLLESLGLIRNARVVVANDSGFYHCSAILRRPTVVLFTFTSVEKNRDERLHKTANVMGADLDCRKDCHAKSRWKKCPYSHKCTDFPAKGIVNNVMEVME